MFMGERSGLLTLPPRRKRFIVRVDEKLTAFVELESAIHDGQRFAAAIG
jgi:hypothetical protein